MSKNEYFNAQSVHNGSEILQNKNCLNHFWGKIEINLAYYQTFF